MSHVPKVDLAQILEADVPGASVDTNPDHWRREFYIPVGPGKLSQRLSGEPGLTEENRSQLLRFSQLLAAWLHCQYHHRIEKLKEQYDPFDPDRHGSLTSDSVDSTERNQRVATLIENVTDLLRRANYHKLTRAQVEEAVAAASDWGVRLKVNFSMFQRLEVYARGDVVGKRVRHRWQNLYRPEEVGVPIYQRLAILFELGETKRADQNLMANAVYIKLFKNIPKQDVDMMLPGVRAKLSLFDSGKILLPTLSGVIVAGYKIIAGLILTAMLGLASTIVLLGGLLGYAIRSVFGYVHTQNKYELNLTRSLYFQNLDNSVGVLLRLTDEAEHQEFCEIVLAYYLLWREAGSQGLTADELDQRAESYLRELCGHGIDFDVEDALASLKRLALADHSEGGNWRAEPIDRAVTRLSDACVRHFQQLGRCE